MSVSPKLKEKFPGGSEVSWTDAEGEWLGWKLPEGAMSPRAVPLPDDGVAIRDVGIALVKTPEQTAAEAREAKAAGNVAAWSAEIATLLAMKPADMTAAQVRRLARLTAKVVLRIGLEVDE